MERTIMYPCNAWVEITQCNLFVQLIHGNLKKFWMWWGMFVISATREAEIGGLQFEASPGKVSTKVYLKNRLEAEEVWLWW
jgi:hypothetical protein